MRRASCRLPRNGPPEQRAPRRLLPALQAAEYLRAFLTGRLGWNRLGGNLVISGAFGLFEREAMIAAGGYEHETVGAPATWLYDPPWTIPFRRRNEIAIPISEST